jgi:hypothetical protein
MPIEEPLTDAGLEIWPRSMYDLVTQISREDNHPIVSVTFLNQVPLPILLRFLCSILFLLSRLRFWTPGSPESRRSRRGVAKSDRAFDFEVEGNRLNARVIAGRTSNPGKG